jgi:hypothetical protein
MFNNLIKLQPQCIRHRLSAQLNKPTATVTSLSLLELFISIKLIIYTTKKQERSSSSSRQSDRVRNPARHARFFSHGPSCPTSFVKGHYGFFHTQQSP